MTEPVSLEVHRGGRKEPCIYCGGEAHPTFLACPRIESVYISPEGNIECIEFREGWEPPKLAG